MTKTVGELKKAMQNIPDDIPIEVYEGRGNNLISFVDMDICDDLNCPDCKGEGTCRTHALVIFADIYKDE
jgi:predicted methyltransferase